MSVVKVVEIMAGSPTSWEDAAQKAVEEAARTLHNIRSFYIKEHHASVENGKIKEYRITGKLTFELERSEK
ncbi:MAG: dodecin [Mucilaginibacter sp.]|nr:dodecin [Mucilaginibacter sp.]